MQVTRATLSKEEKSLRFEFSACALFGEMEEPIDLNNNAEEKIYSLRPRTATKSRELDQEEEAWKPRGRTKKRPKQKSAPLSKYRRKTANARERSRMREINEAFEALRRAVPHLNAGGDNAGEKVSKIMTLRLAMKYITALSNALSEPETCLSDLAMSCQSLTPGSLSERSTEFGEEFFCASLTESPSYDAPGLVTPPLCDLNLPGFDHLRTEPALQPSFDSRTLESSTLQPLSSTLLGDPCTVTSQISSVDPHRDLRAHALTPPDDVSRHFPSYQFKESLTLQTNFLTDFDGLPSPAMDFEDLFIK